MATPSDESVLSAQASKRVFLWGRWGALVSLALFASIIVWNRYVAAVKVRAIEVTKGDVVVEIFGRGTIESRREVQLGFDMVGRISGSLVDEGDRVKLGQVVGHLAPERYVDDVKTATSGVFLARAAVARLEAHEHRELATLTFAATEETRVRRLAESGAVTATDLDLAVQQLELAKAARDRVRAAREEAGRQIGIASKTAESRNVNAMRSVLVSPFDGIVVRRPKDTGDTVSVGTTVLRIVATDALWSSAWVDDSTLLQLRDGQSVLVRLSGDEKSFLVGTVDRIGALRQNLWA
jgi:multidrug efflux pump subunit AcrA (membrane-fusion protein)